MGGRRRDGRCRRLICRRQTARSSGFRIHRSDSRRGSGDCTTSTLSYDRRQQVLDPAHPEELLKDKRKALGSTRGSRLSNAVPESETLLDASFARGESASRQTPEESSSR